MRECIALHCGYGKTGIFKNKNNPVTVVTIATSPKSRGVSSREEATM